MSDYKKLEVWQKAYELALLICKATKKFPKPAIYCLGSQMERASVSIPSNIAEGQTRQHCAEGLQFLYISLGSLAELDTQLMLAKDLSYIDIQLYDKADELLNQTGRMLRGLINSLK